MRTTIFVVLVGGLALHLAASLAVGQTLLQRLEGRLNRVLAEDAAPPADALPPPTARQPGYLGLFGDDTAAAGKGVRVEEVYAGSPAETAGLRVGDIVAAIDGKPLKTTQEMGAQLSSAAAGTKLTFTIERDGRRQEVPVTLGSRPTEAARDEEDPGPAPSPATAPISPAEARPDTVLPGRASLGITAAPLSEETRARYGTSVRRGALITAVRPGTPADHAGLPVGGVVVAVDGRRIDTSDELIAAVQSARPGQEMELTYYQGDRLARKTVRLAAATAAVAPGLGNPASSVPAAPIDRPLLRKVERLVDNFARNGGGVAVDVGPQAAAPVTSEVVELRQQIDALQAEVRALRERVKQLEAPQPDAGEAAPPRLSPPPLPAPARPQE